MARKARRKLSRDEILEAHAYHESTLQSLTPTKPYRDLLAVVYKRLAEDWGVPVGWAECVAYGLSVRRWPSFPDTPAALKHLKKHFKLVILSNVDNASFALSNKRLGVVFDAIYAAEDIGSYKPNPRNFDYMLDMLAGHGFKKRDILHTAESLFHDHGPANKIGLRSAWIWRRHADQGFGATMDPGETPKFDFKFTSMAEMAAAHRKEAGA